MTQQLNEELARLQEERSNIIKISSPYYNHRLGEIDDKIRAIKKLIDSELKKVSKTTINKFVP
jgi:hypothetical protein